MGNKKRLATNQSLQKQTSTKKEKESTFVDSNYSGFELYVKLIRETLLLTVDIFKVLCIILSTVETYYRVKEMSVQSKENAILAERFKEIVQEELDRTQSYDEAETENKSPELNDLNESNSTSVEDSKDNNVNTVQDNQNSVNIELDGKITDEEKDLSLLVPVYDNLEDLLAEIRKQETKPVIRLEVVRVTGTPDVNGILPHTLFALVTVRVEKEILTWNIVTGMYSEYLDGTPASWPPHTLEIAEDETRWAKAALTDVIEYHTGYTPELGNSMYPIPDSVFSRSGKTRLIDFDNRTFERLPLK